MHILIVSNFSVEILNKMRGQLPGADVRQFASFSDAPGDVLARADAIYTSSRMHDLAPEAVPNVRWVQNNWAGVDHIIDHPLFASGRVMLTTAAGVHAPNMSEHALLMMMALGHHLPLAFEMMRAKVWNANRAAFMPLELGGATAGIIGYGALGEAIAERCLAFGMRVIATASSRADGADPRITFVPRGDLDAVLSQADFVVIVVPLAPGTRGLIDARRIARMKPTAYLVNISRGEVTDEAALIEALQTRRIAGAALDVFSTEPLPGHSPFWELDNVILTPHIAGATLHYQERASELFIDNLRRFEDGRRLRNLVDFSRGY